MTIEQQVANKELSLRLKELGYPQEGLFTWVKVDSPSGNHEKVIWGFKVPTYVLEKKYNVNVVCTAPTVAGLGEWLPKSIGFESLQITKGFGEADWLVGYGDHINFNGIKIEHGETEADVRAEMLIWLVENNYVSFEGRELDDPRYTIVEPKYPCL
jgi:hypothetical protein